MKWSRTKETKAQESARQNASDEWTARFQQICERAAAGDLEARMLHNDPSTAEGRLGGALNHLLDMTDAFVRESRAALEHASQGKFYRKVLLTGMHGSFRHASGVINGATENMENQAKAVKDAESSRQSLAEIVASSAEEMTASVGEVGRQTLESASIASSVVETIARITAEMGELSEASRRVGELAKLISGIAQHTRLLSFNATLESSRAGEAGKGFAVVASEVRQLANQISSATDSVTSDIQAMHKAAHDAASSVNAVGGTVRQMSDISHGIAVAVQEQRATMADISKNARCAVEAT